MMNRYWVISALMFLLLQGCAHPGLRQELRRSVPTAARFTTNSGHL